MKVLCTGSLGFIGRHVVSTLLSAGHEVRPTDKKPEPHMASSGIWVDITNFNQLEMIFQNNKFDAIIHLAAQPSLQTSIENPIHDANVNIIGTLNLLELCKRHEVNRFVFAGTSAVYAPKEDGIYQENDAVGPLAPYGVSKATAERYIQISGLSYAILRLGNVYGPGQEPLGVNQLIPRALAHIYQEKHFVINGDGEQKRDFVYVKDVADAFVKAVESDVDGVFNVANGLSWKVFDVLELVKFHTGFDKKFVHGPEQEGELRNVVLPSHFAYNKLGWKAETSLDDGIAKTVKAWPK